MSNSALVSHINLSPNCSKPRRAKIDTISIHCMAGNLTVESCGAMFAKAATKASSNYGIGSDGRIALYVDEGNRSWCTSSTSNDDRAITIEVANTVAAHPWPVSEAAYNSLINLLVDICQRNNIKKLLWQGDKNLVGQVAKQNMTAHRWFANKACPGDYLYNRHSAIAAEVNKRLEDDDMTGKEIHDKLNEYYAAQPLPDWAKEPLAEAVEMGITDGTNPMQLIPRYQAAIMAKRAAENASK